MINEYRIPQACREVMLILGVLPKKYFQMVPREVRLAIMEYQDIDHHPAWENELDEHTDAENLDVLHETLVLIAALNMEYWVTDPNEKERLRAVYDQNDENRLFWQKAGKLIPFPMENIKYPKK